jgi:hypothetical protein
MEGGDDAQFPLAGLVLTAAAVTPRWPSACPEQAERRRDARARLVGWIEWKAAQSLSPKSLLASVAHWVAHSRRVVPFRDDVVRRRVLRRLVGHPNEARIVELLDVPRTKPNCYSPIDHGVGLADMVLSLVPEEGVFVETGRLFGVSTELLALLRPKAVIYSVDLFPKSEAALRLQPYQNVRLLDTDTLTAAAQMADASVDFLYIDADHEFQNATRELRTWLPKLKPTSVLGGHDYCADWLAVVISVMDVLGSPPHYAFSDASWAYVFEEDRP